MFSHEGSNRSSLQNRLLAGYLAFVGGFVNSCGFVLIGTFTSHVTGNVGRLANDAAFGHYGAALAALTMVVCFFGGAFTVSVMIESHFFAHTSRAYATALAGEAVLLITFTLLSYVTAAAHPRVQDAEALLLCAAMGMQNALVTRLSGAVVRTTHLTGVVTDLGIESARWFRYWRRTVADVTHFRMHFGSNIPERPASQKILLLATIAVSFLIGAAFGAISAVHIRHASMLLAAAAVGACSVYAIRGGRADEDDSATSRR
jgi:uncharacterized membrane protein YoaK (UPF0700 family)